jgi:sec-independent protein translocase protein TatA
MDVGPAELLIVLLIALLVFGGAKLPKLARSMGQAAKEFRSGVEEGASSSTSDTAASASTDAERTEA